MKNFGLTRVLGLAILTISMSVQASYWDWSRPYRGPTRDIITLVVTSNYKNSRMMADLIQGENRQPYILLPAVGQNKIFFCPARGERSLEIQEADLARFIKYINPQQIMIIGDNNYVPEKYRAIIDQNQTVISVKNKNWNEAAKQVQYLLGLSNLAYDYRHLSEELESGKLYRSTAHGTGDQYKFDKKANDEFKPSEATTGTPDAPALMGDEGKAPSAEPVAAEAK